MKTLPSLDMPTASWNGLDDDNVILEIKTMREEGFARVKAAGKPKKHHMSFSCSST